MQIRTITKSNVTEFVVEYKSWVTVEGNHSEPAGLIRQPSDLWNGVDGSVARDPGAKRVVSYRVMDCGHRPMS
jgi:hypothetical protein